MYNDDVIYRYITHAILCQMLQKSKKGLLLFCPYCQGQLVGKLIKEN